MYSGTIFVIAACLAQYILDSVEKKYNIELKDYSEVLIRMGIILSAFVGVVLLIIAMAN